MNFEEIREWLKPRLNEEKYLHSLGAEGMARELAYMLGVDEEKAALAGLVHDNSKDMSYEDMLKLIEQDNIDIEEDVKSNPKILHAYIGAYIASKELGIEDSEILNGIKYHTTGRVDMSLFEKIIYLADKIEANTRDLDFREEVLGILKETNNPDKAILLCIDRTIRSLLDRKLSINYVTIEIWNDYLAKLN